MPYKDKDKQKKAQHESYLRNKDRILERNVETRKALNAKVKALLTPCEDCGAFDPRFMDWHHNTDAPKVAGIGEMVRRRFQWETIQEELAKCICLCSNCHRIRHNNSGMTS